MKPSSAYSPAQIRQTGIIARTCLTSGQRGKVLAAFSKAIFLLPEAGELFWIAAEDAPLHQRCARIDTPLPELSSGAPFHIKDQCLTIEPGFNCGVDRASLWQAPRLEPNQVLEITRFSARVYAFFSQLDLAQAKGFGVFIPHILARAQNEPVIPAGTFADPILLFAQSLVLDMARACLEHDPSRISRDADQLIGLGTGLTPSGDDFLGGLSFAVTILQTAYPHSRLIRHTLPVEAYRSRTHVISFALLQDLASGQAIAPLHHIVNGLLTGQSFESIYPFTSRLTQIGHSTGWDLLTGLLTGLLSTY